MKLLKVIQYAILILIGVIIGFLISIAREVYAEKSNLTGTVPKSEYYTCLDRCELKYYKKFVY